jgi:hypothetical protein
MNEQRRTISREQLYHQLWRVPISRLTVELGYSYVELVKICAELKIPRPTGGYWYRLQHGGTSEQVVLPPAPDGTETEIPLGPRLNAQLLSELPAGGGEPAQTRAAESAPKENAENDATQVKKLPQRRKLPAEPQCSDRDNRKSSRFPTVHWAAGIGR